MTETDPEKRLIGYACISTYGRMLDTQLSRAHLRRRRRSGIGRLTDPTAVAQLWLRAGSSWPNPAIAADLSIRLSQVASRHAAVEIEPHRLTLGTTIPRSDRPTPYGHKAANLFERNARW